MPQAPFGDRREAGRRLARELLPLASERPLIVGLPRGGIPVAAEVATALDAPLLAFAVRKLGAPHNPEYGFGAIAEDGTQLIDCAVRAGLGIGDEELRDVIAREMAELRRRVEAYRGRGPQASFEDRLVVVVDDGVATGVTDTTALRALRRRRPGRLVLAVPVCASDSAARLRTEADALVCLVEPQHFFGVGQWYADFEQVSDNEVIAALERRENS